MLAGRLGSRGPLKRLAQLALFDELVNCVGPLPAVGETGPLGGRRLERLLGLRGKVGVGDAQINDEKHLAPSPERGRMHCLVAHHDLVGQLDKGPVSVRALVAGEAIDKANDVLYFSSSSWCWFDADRYLD